MKNDEVDIYKKIIYLDIKNYNNDKNEDEINVNIHVNIERRKKIFSFYYLV